MSWGKSWEKRVDLEFIHHYRWQSDYAWIEKTHENMIYRLKTQLAVHIKLRKRNSLKIQEWKNTIEFLQARIKQIGMEKRIYREVMDKRDRKSLERKYFVVYRLIKNWLFYPNELADWFFPGEQDSTIQKWFSKAFEISCKRAKKCWAKPYL